MIGRKNSKEIILENGFSKNRLPHFFDAEGPSMVRALTFDERRILSTPLRSKDKVSHFDHSRLRRSATFVSKLKLETKDDSTLQDVLYRKYFAIVEENARPTIPAYTGVLKFDNTISIPSIVKEKAVIVVDPFSTGAVLAHEIYLQGYKVICLFSDGKKNDSINRLPDGLSDIFSSILTLERLEDDKLAFEQLIVNISQLPWPVVAIMAGAETGVELADKLSSHLGLRTNGVQLSEARRNKYIMGETIRKAGIRAVKQLKASTWIEISDFLKEWNPNPFQVVLKPVESAGSEDVILCHDINEVQSAYGRIMGKINGLGLLNQAVLVQEYLEGQEYVIDMVSRDGIHKAVAIWECDKRVVNGAHFVLHGYIPRIVSSDHHEQLITYQKSVLTSLGILNGPSHGELKWCRNEPVLVEVGARCHGGEGTWVDVANHVYGYNQVTAAASSYLDLDEFNLIPEKPIHQIDHGRLLCIVSKVSGFLKDINADFIEEIRRMRSFIRMEIFLKPGEVVKKTIDCFTLAGVIMLSHRFESQVENDYLRIREMEDLDLFICEE